MPATTYTPGYSAPILNFMEQRTAETHAAFFLPHLKPGFHLLDAGCGPGTITLGLARRVGAGEVTGIDIEDSQFVIAQDQARQAGLNVTFRKADIYRLPFENASFDAAFSHAVLQHLSDPLAALAELRRVLKPGAVIGIRAGDMGGTLIDGEGPASDFAAHFASREKDEGGDPYTGRKLPRLLRKAGFHVERVSASYEVITELLRKIGPALAAQFAVPGSTCSLQDKPDEVPFVALAWCEAVART